MIDIRSDLKIISKTDQQYYNLIEMT
jgi:hypothetical protein